MLQHFCRETLNNLDGNQIIFNTAAPIHARFFGTFLSFYMFFRLFLIQFESIWRFMWTALDRAMRSKFISWELVIKVPGNGKIPCLLIVLNF